MTLWINATTGAFARFGPDDAGEDPEWLGFFGPRKEALKDAGLSVVTKTNEDGESFVTVGKLVRLTLWDGEVAIADLALSPEAEAASRACIAEFAAHATQAGAKPPWVGFGTVFGATS